MRDEEAWKRFHQRYLAPRLAESAADVTKAGVRPVEILDLHMHALQTLPASDRTCTRAALKEAGHMCTMRTLRRFWEFEGIGGQNGVPRLQATGSQQPFTGPQFGQSRSRPQ